MQNSTISARNKLGRALWSVVWLLLYRPTPVPLHAWRRWLLVLFGAKVGKPAYLYPSSRVWAPWNLEMGDHSALAPNVDCYCVARVKIGSFTTVSQYSYICAASHDYNDPCILRQPQMPLLSAPVVLGDHVWVAADVFIGPGVTIGEGTVVLARSSVFRDLPAWGVASGSPAKVRKKRELRSQASSGGVEST